MTALPPVSQFRMIFKEQWWCITGLSEHGDEHISKELVPQMEARANEQMGSTKLGDISAQFVPSLEERETIVRICASLYVVASWMPADAASSKGFRSRKVCVLSSGGGEKYYQAIGNLTLRLRLKRESTSLAPRDIRPNHLQQIIFRVSGTLMREFKEHFLFDEQYPPYVMTVCHRYEPDTPYIEWTPETTELYKSEIAQFSELYSGQFDDYRAETYRSRIVGDLSNRKSEIHLLNKNSAFIYMDEDNYNRFFIRDEDTPASTGYMFSTLLTSVLRMRNIQVFMQIVNREIERDQDNLCSEEYLEKPPTSIKDDLERTNRLKTCLQSMLTPIWTDMTRSHRQHYSSVLARMAELAQIKSSWKQISQRIEANSHELTAIFLDKQEETAQRQESILNTVNMLLGASIIFEIVSNVTMDDSLAQPINRYLSFLLIAIFVLNLLRLRIRNKKSSSSSSS